VKNVSATSTPTTCSPDSEADPAERDQIVSALIERREVGGRREQRARAQDVSLAAMDGRRLQEAGQLAGGEDRLLGRSKQAGREAPLEAAPSQRNVGAEEGEAGDRQARRPQVVALGQRPEGSEQARHRRFGPPSGRRLAAKEDLRLEQLAGVAQLRIDRLHCPAARPAPAGRASGVGASPSSSAAQSRRSPWMRRASRRRRRRARAARKPLVGRRSTQTLAASPLGRSRPNAAAKGCSGSGFGPSRASGSTLGRAKTSSVRSTARPLVFGSGSPSASAAERISTPSNVPSAVRGASLDRSGTSSTYTSRFSPSLVSLIRTALARRSTQPATLRSALASWAAKRRTVSGEGVVA
jgi:hypothetical protein